MSWSYECVSTLWKYKCNLPYEMSLAGAQWVFVCFWTVEQTVFVWGSRYQQLLSAFLLSTLPPSQQALFFSPAAQAATAAERWQVANEPASRAILSPLDTMIIVDTDWTTSLSHPGISVWTVMSKTYKRPASYYLFPFFVRSFTLSKNTCPSYTVE